MRIPPIIVCAAAGLVAAMFVVFQYRRRGMKIGMYELVMCFTVCVFTMITVGWAVYGIKYQPNR